MKNTICSKANNHDPRTYPSRYFVSWLSEIHIAANARNRERFCPPIDGLYLALKRTI